jgi:hypothetical protein
VQTAGDLRVFIVGVLHRQALGFRGMDVWVKIAEIFGEGGGCEKCPFVCYTQMYKSRLQADAATIFCLFSRSK